MDSGITIRQNVPNGVSPSIRPASSREIGIVSKYPFSIQVQNGTATVEYASRSPSCESIRFSDVMIW